MSQSSGPMTAGYYEPSPGQQLLPGCRVCGSVHPRAFKPAPADIEHCPDCGARAVAAAAPVYVPAVLTGFHPATLSARACFWAAKQLAKLAERI